MIVNSFLTNDCVLRMPCDHAADRSVIGGWTKHVTAVGRTTTSAVLQLGQIKGLFLGCAALTARVVVRCSVYVSVRMRGLFLTMVWCSHIILSFLHASELRSKTWHYFNLRVFFVTVPSSMGRSTARYEGCRYFFIFPQQQAATAITKLSV